MAKLVSKSRLNEFEMISGLSVAIDSYDQNTGILYIKVTKSDFQVYLLLHRSEFRNLVQQYRKLVEGENG